MKQTPVTSGNIFLDEMSNINKNSHPKKIYFKNPFLQSHFKLDINNSIMLTEIIFVLKDLINCDHSTCNR